MPTAGRRQPGLIIQSKKDRRTFFKKMVRLKTNATGAEINHSYHFIKSTAIYLLNRKKNINRKSSLNPLVTTAIIPGISQFQLLDFKFFLYFFDIVGT